MPNDEIQGIRYFEGELDKRFLLFGYDNYYPAGAMSDLLGSFSTLEEALQAAASSTFGNIDLYDRIAGKEVDIDSHE